MPVGAHTPKIVGELPRELGVVGEFVVFAARQLAPHQRRHLARDLRIDVALLERLAGVLDEFRALRAIERPGLDRRAVSDPDADAVELAAFVELELQVQLRAAARLRRDAHAPLRSAQDLRQLHALKLGTHLLDPSYPLIHRRLRQARCRTVLRLKRADCVLAAVVDHRGKFPRDRQTGVVEGRRSLRTRRARNETKTQHDHKRRGRFHGELLVGCPASALLDA